MKEIDFGGEIDSHIALLRRIQQQEQQKNLRRMAESDRILREQAETKRKQDMVHAATVQEIRELSRGLIGILNQRGYVPSEEPSIKYVRDIVTRPNIYTKPTTRTEIVSVDPTVKLAEVAREHYRSYGGPGNWDDIGGIWESKREYTLVLGLSTSKIYIDHDDRSRKIREALDDEILPRSCFDIDLDVASQPILDRYHDSIVRIGAFLLTGTGFPSIVHMKLPRK